MRIWTKTNRQGFFARPCGLAIASVAVLGLSASLSACFNAASYTQPSLVRVIDASYIAPALNVWVEGTELAANIGEGTVTAYGTLPASSAAKVLVTEATIVKPTAANALVASDVTLAAGHQHSVFVTDNGIAPTAYTVTVLEDQQIAAAQGHSAFRFINQAARTGAVDIYMVPTASTLANAVPLYKNLPIGQNTGYISFTSQAVTLYILPAGTAVSATTTTTYKSDGSFSLAGGEVRSVMIVDNQLVSNPPVSVVVAADVN